MHCFIVQFKSLNEIRVGRFPKNIIYRNACRRYTISCALYINFPRSSCTVHMCSSLSSFILKKNCLKGIVLFPLINTPLGVSPKFSLGDCFFLPQLSLPPIKIRSVYLFFTVYISMLCFLRLTCSCIMQVRTMHPPQFIQMHFFPKEYFVYFSSSL